MTSRHCTRGIIARLVPWLAALCWCASASAAPGDTIQQWTFEGGNPWSDGDTNTDESDGPGQSLRLSAGDQAESPAADLSSVPAAELSFWWSRGSDQDDVSFGPFTFDFDPEAGDDLVVEYFDGAAWQSVDSIAGAGAADAKGTVTFAIPTADLTSQFRVRATNTGTANGLDQDDRWFIDSVTITEVAAAVAPLAEWRMDETAWNGTSGEVVDETGNGRDGTARNGAGTDDATPALAGDPGTCGYGTFDGGDDYVNVPGLSGILDDTATLTFWIRTTQTGNDTGWRAPGVAGVEEAGGADDIFWGWIDASGRIGISVGNDYQGEQKSSSAINDGSWHHVALTRDASTGETRVYVDGTLETTGTSGTGTIGNTFTSLGRIEDTGGSPEYLDGDLDEVRVYGQVLSTAEVQSVMSATHACAAFCSADADLSDSFEDGNLNPWQTQGGPGASAGVSSATADDGSNSMFLHGQEIYVRSPNIDLSAAASADLGMWVQRGDDSFSEDPDAGEDLEVQYRTSSNDWATLETFTGSGTPGEIFERTYSLPADAFHPNFRLRFHLTSASGNNFDYWHVDSICLTSVVSGNVDHYAISHDGTAVTCGEEQITITGHNPGDQPRDPGNATISLTTSTGEGTWARVINGTGSLSDATAGDGAASYTFPGNGETSVTLAFNYTTVTAATDPETVNFDVDGGNEGAGEDPDLVVSRSGFRITDGSGNPTTVPGQIAGKPSDTDPGAITLALQAIRSSDSDPAVCEPYFPDGGDVDIELGGECNDPSTCAGGQLSVTNNGNTALLPTSDDNGGTGAASYAPVTLRFGPNAEAPLVLAYDDAGQVQLHARHNPIDDGSGTPPVVNYVVGASNSYVVRPFGFAIDFDPDADTVFDDRDANALCADQVSCAADAGGDVFATAGSGFPVELRAVVWESGDDTDDDGVPDGNQAVLDNDATPNFGQEASPETVDLVHTLAAPAAGNAGTLGGGQGIGGFSGGRAVATGVSWDEVGIIDLAATLSDNAYLGGGDVAGAAPGLGRFIPDHLVVTGNDPGFRDATAPWTSAFTYMGQPFTFAVGSEPRITVTALNASGTTTSNYGGEGTADDFWKLGTPVRSYSDATTGVTGSFSADQGPGSATWDDAGGNDTRADFDGTATLVISGDEFAYDRVDAANPQPPFDALVDLAMAAGDLVDSDNVCNDPDDNGTCDGFTVDADSGSAGQQSITGTELRFGRLVIDSAGGSELAPVSMPVRTEYWTAGSTWNTNGLDSSTALTVASEVDLTNEVGPEGTIATVDGDQLIDLADAPPGNQGQSTINTPPVTVTLVGGTAELEFAAPGTAGQTGWLAALPQLAAGHPYLRYDWDTDGTAPDDVLDDNPRARVTFGIFSGDRNWIHIRRGQ